MRLQSTPNITHFLEILVTSIESFALAAMYYCASECASNWWGADQPGTAQPP